MVKRCNWPPAGVLSGLIWRLQAMDETNHDERNHKIRINPIARFAVERRVTMGMIVVGVPYSTEGILHTEGRGGTPYGPSTVAGSNNALEPTKEDLFIAETLGRRVAEVTLRLRG